MLTQTGHAALQRQGHEQPGVPSPPGGARAAPGPGLLRRLEAGMKQGLVLLHLRRKGLQPCSEDFAPRSVLIVGVTLHRSDFSQVILPQETHLCVLPRR